MILDCSGIGDDPSSLCGATRMIDETDRRIIEILSSDARLPNAEVARRIGLAPSATYERIRKLEERGVIKGYATLVDPHAAGLGVLAFILVRDNERIGQTTTARKVAEIPEVQEVHHVAGEDCLLVKVRVADTEALVRLLRERLGAIETITSTRTIIVLDTVKESIGLRISNGNGGAHT
jgi:Lrp/AsnC family leucine-responsive transcriptional regulator